MLPSPVCGPRRFVALPASPVCSPPGLLSKYADEVRDLVCTQGLPAPQRPADPPLLIPCLLSFLTNGAIP